MPAGMKISRTKLTAGNFEQALVLCIKSIDNENFHLKKVLPWAVYANQFIHYFLRVWKKKLLNQPNKTLRICYRLIHDDFATIRKEKF